MSTEIASVVIPARNESDRVARVVESAQSANPNFVNVENIVVVDNNSVDDTAYWAEKAGAHVYFEPKIGKGHAIKSVQEIARNLGGGALIMLDADLIGLQGEQINQLVAPVLNNELVMNIGYLGKRPELSRMLLRYWGGFSGQRAVSWDVIDALLPKDFIGSRLEAAMNRVPANAGRGGEIGRLELSGVRHVGQREKNSNNLVKTSIAYARIYGSALLGLTTASKMKKQINK